MESIELDSVGQRMQGQTALLAHSYNNSHAKAGLCVVKELQKTRDRVIWLS